MMLALALSWTLIVLQSKYYRLISWKNTFKWAWSLRHVQSYSLAFNSVWHHNYFAAKVEMQSCYLLADSLHPQRWLFHRSHLGAFLCLLAPLFYLLLTLALITSKQHTIQIHLVFWGSVLYCHKHVLAAAVVSCLACEFWTHQIFLVGQIPEIVYVLCIGPMSDGETRVSLSFISVFNHTYMVSFTHQSSFVFYDFVWVLLILYGMWTCPFPTKGGVAFWNYMTSVWFDAHILFLILLFYKLLHQYLHRFSSILRHRIHWPGACKASYRIYILCTL